MYSLTEEEQAEQVKAWIRNYAPSIVFGVILALVFAMGWRYWQQKQETARVKASVHYEVLLSSLMGHDDSAVQYHAARLMDGYAKTPYAKLAALILARQAAEANKFGVAEEKLQWVIKKAHESEFRQIARIRLARLMLAENKPQAALATLQTVEQKTYIPAIEAVKGDVYASMGNKLEARSAYAKALQGLPNSELSKSLLQMKYADLATGAVDNSVMMAKKP